MVTLAALYNDIKTLIKQNFYDKGEIDANKQDKLVSGTNIKTVNNNSLLGSGNISISASGTVDSALSTTSTNPVENQAITNEINSLSGSITNKVDRVYTTNVTCNSNLKFTSTTTISLRRVGKIVIADLYNKECKPTSTGWITIASISVGYRPVANIYCSVTTNATQTQQARAYSNSIQVYVSSAPSGNIYFGFLGVWVTNDSYPL